MLVFVCTCPVLVLIRVIRLRGNVQYAVSSIQSAAQSSAVENWGVRNRIAMVVNKTWSGSVVAQRVQTLTPKWTALHRIPHAVSSHTLPLSLSLAGSLTRFRDCKRMPRLHTRRAMQLFPSNLHRLDIQTSRVPGKSSQHVRSILDDRRRSICRCRCCSGRARAQTTRRKGQEEMEQAVGGYGEA
jgi:hypothetical protein